MGRQESPQLVERKGQVDTDARETSRVSKFLIQFTNNLLQAENVTGARCKTLTCVNLWKTFTKFSQPSFDQDASEQETSTPCHYPPGHKSERWLSRRCGIRVAEPAPRCRTVEDASRVWDCTASCRRSVDPPVIRAATFERRG